MLDLADLIDRDDDAWPMVHGLIQGSPHAVDVLPSAPDLGRQTLHALQVTTRSPMGTIALRTGGLVVDHGWVRILGAGSDHIGGGLREWNQELGGEPLDPPLPDGFVVAYDAAGGFFALNGGAWPGATGGVNYLGPETHEWEDLAIGYSGLLRMLTSEAFEAFYEGVRWPGWEAGVARLGPDQVLSSDRSLGPWTDPDVQLGPRPVPAREVWTLHHALARQT